MNLFCCLNTWVVAKDLMKHHYQIKKAFYSKLYLKNITDEDNTHAQKVFEEFNLKNLGDYNNLYVQNDTLLLTDLLENFRNKRIEMYKLDPAYFLSTPGLAWQASLKKTGIRLDLLSDIDMLLMVEKGIRCGICHARVRYAKANNKHRKVMIKTLNHHV